MTDEQIHKVRVKELGGRKEELVRHLKTAIAILEADDTEFQSDLDYIDDRLMAELLGFYDKATLFWASVNNGRRYLHDKQQKEQ